MERGVSRGKGKILISFDWEEQFTVRDRGEVEKVYIYISLGFYPFIHLPRVRAGEFPRAVHRGAAARGSLHPRLCRLLQLRRLRAQSADDQMCR